MGAVEGVAEPEPPYWSHWWEIVTGKHLRQGDVLRNLTAFWLPTNLPLPGSADPLPPLQQHTRDWIVGTASCDLDAKGFPQVLLLPIHAADLAGLKAKNQKDFTASFEAVRRDLHPRRFMLAEHPEIDPPFKISFAEFANLAFIPTDYVLRACSELPRLRLRSPLREKFGNWVGGRFGSVGPENSTRLPSVGGLHDTALIQVVEE